MRSRVWILIALLAVGPACLQSRVKSTINVRSFLGEDILEGDYHVGPNTPEVEVHTEPKEVTVSERFRMKGKLESAGVDFRVVYHHGKGHGQASIDVHVGETAETVYN
ncbi:MAG: hypothetical protein ACE5G2_03895, partial [Candidatus Krumholzibacteriia bacterium]